MARIEINAEELALLHEAARSPTGEITVRVAGRKPVDDAEAHRCQCLEVLEHAGFLDDLGQRGAVAVWRLKPDARRALERSAGG